MLEALKPLFRSRPDSPVRELDRRLVLLLRVLVRPRATGVLWGATVRSVFDSSDLRNLFRAYLGSSEARAEAPVHLLLKDCFRLRLVAESGTSVELEQNGRTLVYRTDPAGSRNGVVLDAATVGLLERIVWDHSAVGASVTSKDNPRISVALGNDGVHEFEVLPSVARRFPELAARALRRAAGTE